MPGISIETTTTQTTYTNPSNSTDIDVAPLPSQMGKKAGIVTSTVHR